MQQTKATNFSSQIGFYEGSSSLNNVISYLEMHVRDFSERIALEWTSKDRIPMKKMLLSLTRKSTTATSMDRFKVLQED